eukprot:scaffold72801_cov48-Phaeocystis_antarctica.AAC.1
MTRMQPLSTHLLPPPCQIMTGIEDVFGVLVTDTLDFDTLRRICASGYTRIPVFANEQRHEVVGLLSTKDLILLDPEDGLSAEVRSSPTAWG